MTEILAKIVKMVSTEEMFKAGPMNKGKAAPAIDLANVQLAIAEAEFSP